MSTTISAGSYSPYLASLLFSETPLTAEQRAYVQQNFSITMTSANTTVTRQADGTLLAAWHNTDNLQPPSETTYGSAVPLYTKAGAWVAQTAATTPPKQPGVPLEPMGVQGNRRPSGTSTTQGTEAASSSPTNVSTDKTPTLADVAKAIAGSASRNEDFNLLESFFNPKQS